MSTQLTLENFETIYEETYNRTLKYIVCKCSNIEDVNDLIQDTYTELYSMLKKKKDIRVIKVFYLYYCLDLKISQIAIELKISESNVKNILYRTIKDIKKNVKVEGDIDA